MVEGQFVPIDDVAKIMKNKHHFYVGLVSFGNFMPDEKCSINTKEFFTEIRNGEC